MNQWNFIVAGPGLDGWEEAPGVRLFASLALIFVAATLCVVAHDFRLTLHHPPMKHGLIHRIAVWTVFVVACLWTIAWIGLRLFGFYYW